MDMIPPAQKLLWEESCCLGRLKPGTPPSRASVNNGTPTEAGSTMAATADGSGLPPSLTGTWRHRTNKTTGASQEAARAGSNLSRAPSRKGAVALAKDGRAAGPAAAAKAAAGAAERAKATGPVPKDTEAAAAAAAPAVGSAAESAAEKMP